MEQQGPGFEVVYWKNVRDQVRAVNPQFAKLIDAIDPDKHYPLIKARYRYGDEIVKNGITYLPHPSNLSLLPTNSSALKKYLKDYLDYSSIPLFLTLYNANEVYLYSHERTAPLDLFYPGSLLGLFEAMDILYNQASTSTWSVSAGGRTLFMLPKLSEQSGFKKLRIAYNLDQQLQPRYLINHWQLFQAIAQHKSFTQPWHNEILFFTKNWLMKAKTEPTWAQFKDYLLMQAWHQARFAISKIGLNLIWERCSQAMAVRNLKPIPYFVDQVKHILLIALRRLPGFRVAEENNTAIAPINGLQEMITNIYGLKKYTPTLLHINKVENRDNIPLYYSLSFPTLLEGLPHRPTDSSTIMIDIRNIKQIIDTLLPTFNQPGNNETFQLNQMDFKYFHIEPDLYNEILPSQQLLAFDERLSASSKKFPNQSFCASSQFWRGCVRIHQKRSLKA